ncbi:MAG TPA: peptide chain release factor N(5)-glutamine methyltransferase [Burkholderiales bacterium]|nr:peptide chain release factor N(5)-glutamine methyltransferase [Burkholderiales bacterium]
MSAVEAGSTIEGLLRESRLPRREAEILLQGVLRCDRARLIAHAEQSVDSAKALAARAWFSRRLAGEPIAHILGVREFYGLALRVTADVLIPRPETELLVELALGRAGPGARVLELGTGSGAVAVALWSKRPDLKITASDISQEALEIARRNADAHGADIDFVRSNWFEAVGPAPFDLIASNPPYVAEGDPHLKQGDLRFEPRLALLGGGDGLACVRAIAARARYHLRPGGRLLLEHGYDQGERCVALLREIGYAEVADSRDLAGLPRVCAGVWRG